MSDFGAGVVVATLQLVDHFSGVAMGVVNAAESIAEKFEEFTQGAVEEAAKIERLTLTFGALTHSMTAASEKMQFLKDFAKASILEFDDLAEASTLMEAAGLRTQRLITTLSNAVGAFGGGRDKVNEFAMALARIPSGVYGESMEVFRRFGITAADFLREGLTFTKGGQLEGSALQVLTAVEAIVKRKFGDMEKIMGDSIAVRFSNLTDGWNQMIAQFGSAWFPFIRRVTDSLSRMMSFLTDSGIAGEIGGKFADAISKIFDFGAGGKGELLTNVMLGIVAVFEELPGAISIAYDNVRAFFMNAGTVATAAVNYIRIGFVDMFNFIKNGVFNVAEANRLAWLTIADSFVDTFNFVKGGWEHFMDVIRSGVVWLLEAVNNISRAFNAGERRLNPLHPQLLEEIDTRDLRKPWSELDGGLMKKTTFGREPLARPRDMDQAAPFTDFENMMKRMFGGLPGGFGDISNKIMDDFHRLQQMYGGYSPRNGVAGAGQGSFGNFIDQQIADNTKRTADAVTDFSSMLRAYVIGGGPLAQIGITPTELGRNRAATAPKIVIDGGREMRGMHQWITDMIEQVAYEMQRQNQDHRVF